MMCQGMKWNHLPEGGGLYAQNPKLLDRFYYVMVEQSKAQNEEIEKQKKESESKSGKGRRGRFRGRR